MSGIDEDRRILRALCQTEDAGERRRACEILENRRWTEPEHRIIFEACARLTRFGAGISAAALAVQLTRAGFPEVDLDDLFEPLPQAAAELARRTEGRKEPPE
jgi:replicative DNA helicase